MGVKKAKLSTSTQAQDGGFPTIVRCKRHVNIAIAYNVWQYYQATLDTEFLSSYGAEMVLDIARFWASATTYNQRSNAMKSVA